MVPLMFASAPCLARIRPTPRSATESAARGWAGFCVARWGTSPCPVSSDPGSRTGTLVVSILTFHPMQKCYANRIRAIRRNRDWRLADLAERLGCDPSDLGKWERGEREPTLRTALRIAQLLGERVEDIFWDHTHDAWARLRALHGDAADDAQAPEEEATPR